MRYYRFKNTRTLAIVKIIDRIGFLFKKIIKRKRLDAKSINKILLVRLDHIGDCVLTTPAIKYLKNKLPESHITVLANPISYEVFNNNPDVNEIIVYDAFWFKRNSKKSMFSIIKDGFHLLRKLRNMKFDIAVDFRGDIRNIFFVFLAGIKIRIGYGIGGGGFLLAKEVEYVKGIHEVEKNINIIRDMFDEKRYSPRSGTVPFFTFLKPILYTPSNDEALAKKILEKNNISANDLLVGIHPGAGFPAKLWLETEWSKLIEKLVEVYNAKIIITGSKNEGDMLRRIKENVSSLIKNRIFAISNLNLSEFMSIVKHYKLLVSVDSAAMHIASAFNVPVIAIMSATNDVNEWRPIGDKNVVIQKDVNCRLCELEECKEHICMSSITSAQIIKTISDNYANIF